MHGYGLHGAWMRSDSAYDCNCEAAQCRFKTVQCMGMVSSTPCRRDKCLGTPLRTTKRQPRS